MRQIFPSFILISIAILAGCAKTGGECGRGNQFRIPWPTASGNYEFQTIALETLNNPYELSGSAARIYFESKLTDSGFNGSVAQPRLTRSGDVCIPTDAGSVATVSAYAQMEKLYRFDQKLGIAQQIAWPRNVGIQIHLQDEEGATENNGLYFPKSDAMAVAPYTLEGIPLALNHGILAHEHFHAHFQSQVLNSLNSSMQERAAPPERFFSVFSIKPRVEDVDAADLRSFYGLNQFVLRAWNEGLADLYAVISQERTDFFTESFPNRLTERTLAGPLEGMRQASEIIYYAREKSVTRGQLKAVSYQEGTRMARLLYQFAQSNDNPEGFLQELMNRLKEIPEAVAPHMNTKVMEFDALVSLLLRGRTLTPTDCERIQAVMTKPTFHREFSRCL